MKGLIAGILGAVSIMAMTAATASAEIVCNREGDCWHVKEHGWVRREHGLIVHPDDWKWREREHYRWREHEGHGYWREGRWIEIH